ncbi:NAD(P)-dependent dehydrogenase (short-subunit alcohol dehydrogenase family) [Streptomyces sp. V4I8]
MASWVAAQEASRRWPLLGGRARFSRVDGEGEAGFGGHLQALEGEGELADRRVVEALHPGAAVADVVGGEFDRSQAEAGQAIDRLGTTDEIAQAVLWLSSPGGVGYVTGVALPVDGGYVAQ